MSDVTSATAEDVPPLLLGTWKLVSSTRVDMPSGKRSDMMGSHPLAFINYCRDGRMMFLQAGEDRKKPAGAQVTDAEAAALYRTFLGYAGTYTIKGDTITHHVDLSWNETWTGSDQVRQFKFDGNRVTLSTALSPDPVHGVMSIRELVWQKVE